MSDRVEQVSIVSDSETALWWMKSTKKKLPIFVANQHGRITKIQNESKETGITLKFFFHVDSKNNPADAGKRGLTALEIDNHDWIKGPHWLKSSPNTWPIKLLDFIEEVDSQENTPAISNMVNISTTKEKVTNEVLLDLTRFSKLNKVLRVIALTQFEITASDIELSEQIVIMQEQKYLNLDEMQKKFHDKKIVSDQYGIIRHESRLQNACIPQDAKSPIYIP
ncbi:hypothetical protein OESDEN_19917 [Oesophagostomum dentatum]|uniref:Uncharacterized protein n=1 Tax=Oesophagostomum dentatum TaxID=61180 RepID=A0A0B1SA36_OESDE|nr:hypothetical protein OESDEN_19917 [Oesophagostomum dentatum]